MAKKRVNITIDSTTKERLLQFSKDNHITGGLSGVIEFIAWNNIEIIPSYMNDLLENDLK